MYFGKKESVSKRFSDLHYKCYYSKNRKCKTTECESTEEYVLDLVFKGREIMIMVKLLLYNIPFLVCFGLQWQNTGSL